MIFWRNSVYLADQYIVMNNFSFDMTVYLFLQLKLLLS